jgi:membrane-associated phospholipid phosphatase
VGWQRVASGGHFLSDVLLSWLFVALVAAVLGRVMLRPAQGPD